MRYLSVCSGIEAATVAWEPLGWTPHAFAEIEKFPSALLAHHYPTVANLGDMTRFQEWPDANIDVLVGGTPCQAFSVAGLRKGLADPRGNLTLTFLALAARHRPAWVVWENVPGVLSDATGAFGAFLGGLAELGYGWAYRVLDAQYFGVAQRRRRVFVVGSAGDWRRAGAVLFERESLSGNPAPRRAPGKNAAPTLDARAGRSGETSFATSGGLVAPTIPSRASAGGGMGTDFDLDGGIIPVQSVQAVREKKQNGIGIGDLGDEMFTLTGRDQHAVAFTQNQREEVREVAIAGALAAEPGMKQQTYLAAGVAVRRLTPRECERLQGFPDDYTLIPYRGKPAVDGPRYKALGNSMAVPVMRWIGERLASVEALR